MEEEKKPSIKEMAFGLTDSIKTSITHFIHSGVVMAQDDVVNKRIDLCVACPSFDAQNSRCLKCGCFMNLKTRLAAATCPLGKW